MSLPATTELRVSGMTCNNCVRHVTEAIQGVPGVQSVSVNLQDAAASIRWNSVEAKNVTAARRTPTFKQPPFTIKQLPLTVEQRTLTPRQSPSTRQQSPLTARQPAFTFKQSGITARQSPRTFKQCPQTLEKSTVAAAQSPRAARQWPETADFPTNPNNLQ